MNAILRTAVAVSSLGLFGPIAGAQTPNPSRTVQQLKLLSFEELMALQVTSVSRHAESASHAAAAVEVITAEQIERTGAASLPDVLRFATGVQVSRFAGHSFALSTRGFTSVAANKLQVMQDGRSLYSPLFSGVFWDAFTTMLEDLDRIEVVRGPGATMWGANAVNGVINIISKDALETQGTLLSAGGGTEERAFAALRYGGRMGPQSHFRIYGRYQERDELALPSGADATGRPVEYQGGFRFDSRPGSHDHLTLQSDYAYTRSDLPAGNRPYNRSINALGRWTHTLEPNTDLQLQAYYDRFERDVPGQFGEKRDTFDLDGQFRGHLGARHEIVAGLDYRISRDHTAAGGTTQFVPQGKTIQLLSGFAQDEIILVPDRLAVVVGTKFEWDSLDGTEPQPNVRVAWTPADRETVWAAISRAVRMPSRIDEDLRFIPVPATGVAFVTGNPDFKPEKLLAYELGYRFQAHEHFSVDVATFYNEYRDLRSLEPSLPLGIPLVQFNRLDARTCGAEFALHYQPAAWWRLSGNYTYLDERLRPRPESHDPNHGSLEGNDARHLYSVWASFDLPRNVTFDAMVRHVDALPVPAVPSYIEADARLGVWATDRLQLVIVGQNLLHARHRESGANTPAASEVQRGVYGKIHWRF